MPTYQDQLERVKRYYQRFAAIDAGLEMHEPLDHYMDDIYSFFQNCYHLKDWLKKDPAFTTKSDSQIEAHVTNSPDLAVCADLCNLTKHLVLTKPARSGKTPSWGRRAIQVIVGGPRQVTSIKAIIEHNGNEIDAFSLAGRSIGSWEAFVA